MMSLDHPIYTSTMPYHRSTFTSTLQLRKMRSREVQHLAQDHRWRGRGDTPRLSISLRPEGVVSVLATWCHSFQAVGRLPSRDGPSTGDSGQSSVRSVQSLSRVRLFVTPWTAALQASLSITNSKSLLKQSYLQTNPEEGKGPHPVLPVNVHNPCLFCFPIMFERKTRSHSVHPEPGEELDRHHLRQVCEQRCSVSTLWMRRVRPRELN